MSPFRRWLEANQIPSDSEITQVKRFLEPYLIQREVLTTQLTEAKFILDSLQEGRAHLQEAIDAHRAILHPVRRVPSNVWQKIFIYSLPSPHRPIMDATDTPLSLTRVCTSWRNIALSSPMLWSSLHITIPTARTHQSHWAVTTTALSAVHRWLSNAAGEKISISVQWPQDPFDDYGTKEEFPFAILQYSRSILSLELINIPDDALNIFLTSAVSSFPSLEEIIVRLPGTGHRSCDQGAEIENANIWKVPTLKKVALESVKAELSNLPLTWSRLEEIEVCGSRAVPTNFLNNEEALSLACASPKLKKLRIQLTDYRLSDPIDAFRRLLGRITLRENSTRISLAYLTTLDISDVLVNRLISRDNHLSFVETLQLPALETLKYRLAERSPRTPVTDIHPLLTFLISQRSPIKIREWVVEANSMSRETFMDCLLLMSQLSCLWVRDGQGLGQGSLNDHPAGEFWLPEEIGREICPDDWMFETLTNNVVTDESSTESTDNLDGGRNKLACPLLERLRVDRARFTLDGIRNFVQSRLIMGMPVARRQRSFAPLQDIQLALLYTQPASDLPDCNGNHGASSLGRLEADLHKLNVRAKISFIPPAIPANGLLWKYVETKPIDGLTINGVEFEGGLVGH